MSLKIYFFALHGVIRRHDKYISMTLLNANRSFFENMKYYVVHLLQSISFFPFYLRVMPAENTIYSYIQLTGFTYSRYTLSIPPLNIIEVHPIYRSVMFCIWIFGVKVCLLCRFFVSFYVYIKSRLFGELNGSYFRNKAQYLVSIFIFCSDLFTLQFIVIDLKTRV